MVLPTDAYKPWRVWSKARRGLPCSLCDCLLFEIPSPIKSDAEAQSVLFHDPCEDCSQDVDPSDCCAFCHHLRMRHLLICLPNQSIVKSMEKYESLETFAIKLGSIATLKSRKRCPLCRFFYDITSARYRLWQQRIPGESNPIILEFSNSGPVLIMSHEGSNAIGSSVHDTREHCITDRSQPSRARFSTHDIRKHSNTPRHLSSKVNWSILHQWRQEYMPTASLPESEELYSQHTSTPRLPQPLLVIDVENGCIVSKSTSCTYAALSYVWGNPTKGDLQATLANISNLEKPGALKQAGVPLTILDAMTAASKLGIPYLWVDRLCIVQDDQTTKHNLINQMDSIYASALFTFVAGAGKDASYGLPGVSKKRSPGQAHIRIQGMELTEVLPKFCDDIIRRTAWMQRGWTYQEAMFSANLVFFTDYGVFYDRAKASSRVLAEPPNSHDRSAFSWITDFFGSVEAYSERTLSYETDIEKAFSGVLRSYFGEDYAYGSPLRSFDAALRWTSSLGLSQRRRSTDNDVFPSWSWLSAIGRVDFREAGSTEDYLPVATWAMNLPTGSGGSELRFIAPESDEEFKYNASLVDETWKAGFFEGGLPSCSNADTASCDMWRPTWKSYHSFWLQSRGLKSISAPSQSGLCEKYPVCLRPGQVIVRTKSAHLHISQVDIEHSRIMDRRTRSTCKLYMEYSSEGIGELEYVEVIALSTRRRFNVLVEMLFSCKGADYEQMLMVDIMAIRRVDGVAYRTGLGWVSLKEWEEAKPTFKTIVLG